MTRPDSWLPLYKKYVKMFVQNNWFNNLIDFPGKEIYVFETSLKYHYDMKEKYGYIWVHIK